MDVLLEPDDQGPVLLHLTYWLLRDVCCADKGSLTQCQAVVGVT